jgi:hypothetical protein
VCLDQAQKNREWQSVCELMQTEGKCTFLTDWQSILQWHQQFPKCSNTQLQLAVCAKREELCIARCNPNCDTGADEMSASATVKTQYRTRYVSERVWPIRTQSQLTAADEFQAARIAIVSINFNLQYAANYRHSCNATLCAESFGTGEDRKNSAQ